MEDIQNCLYSRETLNFSTPFLEQVCRDECEMLEESICRMEYAIAKKHPLIESILPACQDLPSAGSKDSVNCLRMGVPNVVQVVHGKSREWDEGRMRQTGPPYVLSEWRGNASSMT